MRESIIRFVYENWGKVLGGIIGLLIALVISIFGLWTGLFIIVCVLAGIYLGGRVERRDGLHKYVNFFWTSRDDE